MIIDEIKAIQSSRSDLKKFGLSVGIVLALIGLILLFKNRSSYVYFLLASAILIIPALTFPSVLKPLQKLWMGLAIVLGWISTRVILSLLYYLVLTPIGIFMRLSGKDLLDIKIQKERQSYWNYRELKQYDPADSEKQF